MVGPRASHAHAHARQRSFGSSIGRAALAAGIVGSLLTAFPGCGNPKFPSCDNDDHCNADGHKGVCINHTCVECRTDETCGAGKECKAGACAAIENYCDDASACAGGAECGKDHRCHDAPKVAVAPAVECDDGHPCKGAGERCQNNHCVAPVQGGPGCQEFPAPRFDFESPDLKVDSRGVLERLAGCLNGGSLKGRHILLTGHCDNRGENEFNMSLGAQRAEVVRGFLIGLGVPAAAINTSSRGELDANGTDDAGYSNDRRVDIEVR